MHASLAAATSVAVVLLAPGPSTPRQEYGRYVGRPQWTKPPDRASKDNRFETHADRHNPRLRVLLEAWEQCLFGHVTSLEHHMIHSRVVASVQNQYSEHAAWELLDEIARMVADDMEMPKSIYAGEGRKLLVGAGDEPEGYVWDLLDDVFDTSGDVLRFRGIWGDQGTLMHQHELVLIGDEGVLERLESLDARELTKQQRWAMKELAKRVESSLFEALGVEGSRHYKARLRSRLAESLETTDTDRALRGVRSTIRFVLRRSSADPGDAAGWIGREVELEAGIDEVVGLLFWEQLRLLHDRFLREPKRKRELRDFTWEVAPIPPAASVAAEPAAAEPAPRTAEVAGEATGAEEDPPDTLRLRYRWPASGEVAVTQAGEKDGTAITATFRLAWTGHPDGGSVFAMEDYEIVSLAGVTEGEAFEGRTGPMEAFANLAPAWRVLPDGAFGGPVDFDYEAMVDALLPLLLPAGADPALGAQLRRRMLAPQAEQAVVASLGEDWSSWVALWARVEIPPPGVSQEEEHAVEVGGAPIPAKVTVTNLGRELVRGRDCVLLAYVQEIDGGRASRATAAMAAALGVGDLEALADVHRRTVIEATVEVGTLRPHLVRVTQEVRAGARTRLEDQTFEFRWPDASAAPGEEPDEGG